MGWLAALLVGIGTVGSDVSGTVVDDRGSPVAGAEVWLVGAATVGNTSFEGEARSDDSGTFSIEIPDEDDKAFGPFWNWVVWASRPGSGLGVEVIARGPRPTGEPVRVALPTVKPAGVSVLDPARKPLEGVRVRIDALRLPDERFSGSPPAGLRDRLEARTDAQGRVSFDAVSNDRVTSLQVQADGFGWQPRWYRDFGDIDREVWLRPAGRLEGRLVADDPDAVAGWTVFASTTAADESGLNQSRVGSAQATTDDRGRFVMPELAEGGVSLSFRHPDDSRYRAEHPGSGRVQAGETSEIEVRLGRGVTVEGVVRDTESGGPIPGAQFSFFQPGWNSGDTVLTDEEGRFSVVTLPGAINLRISAIPDPYILPWQTVPEGFTVAEGADRIALPPIVARKGVRVSGILRDARGAPAAGVGIRGVWSNPGPDGSSSSRSVQATTDEEGRFTLSPVGPGAAVRLEIDSPGLVLEGPESIVAGAEGEAELRVSAVAVAIPRGRVVGTDGQPIAGARIRFYQRPPRDQMGSNNFPRPLQIRGRSDLIRTGPDGTFQAPEAVPADHSYSAEVTAPGRIQARSGWITPLEDGEDLPQIVLETLPSFRAVAGRVVDLRGEPVADALVFQAGDGPRRTEATTDPDGRFQLEGVYDRDALVFAQADGFRFLGVIVPAAPDAGEVEIRLARLDEPSPRPMTTLPGPLPIDREREIARSLLDPIFPSWLAAAEPSYDDPPPRWERSGLLEAMARLEPDRVIELVERQVASASGTVLTAIALGLFDRDPDQAIEVLDSLGAPAAFLSVFDERPDADPAVRLVLLDRAGEKAGALVEPRDRIQALVQVAGRWRAIDEPDRARPLLQEARDAFEQGPQPGTAFLLPDLARGLAAIDLEGTLALIDRVDDPSDADRLREDQARAAVAEAIAATDPERADRLLTEATRAHPNQRYEFDRTLTQVVFRMAPADLPRAIALADRPEPLMRRAFLRGVIASGLADSDPEDARRVLTEAFGMLGAPGVEGGNPIAPSQANARLLMALVPVAERIDPDLVPDLFWRALALRTDLPEARTSSELDAAIQLAILTSRYDRDAAAALLGPLLDRLPGLASGAEPRWDLVFAILRAASAIDPEGAVSRIALLPGGEAPDPSSPADRGSAVSRVVLADLLARPVRERRREQGPGASNTPLPGDE